MFNSTLVERRDGEKLSTMLDRFRAKAKHKVDEALSRRFYTKPSEERRERERKLERQREQRQQQEEDVIHGYS